MLFLMSMLRLPTSGKASHHSSPMQTPMTNSKPPFLIVIATMIASTMFRILICLSANVSAWAFVRLTNFPNITFASKLSLHTFLRRSSLAKLSSSTHLFEASPPRFGRIFRVVFKSSTQITTLIYHTRFPKFMKQLDSFSMVYPLVRARFPSQPFLLRSHHLLPHHICPHLRNPLIRPLPSKLNS